MEDNNQLSFDFSGDKATVSVNCHEQELGNAQKSHEKQKQDDDARKKVDKLTDILNKALKSYEADSVEIMSNFEYDRLYDELTDLQRKTGYIRPDSPTKHAGYDVLSELPKERHEKPMLSLDKTKQTEVLSEWLGSHEGLLSWKMDGLTIVLTYRNGRLEKAVTRGNGEIGEVITSNARQFKNLPLNIEYKGTMVLRGEAVIGYSDFVKLNETIADTDAKYKNPRNLCSGSVRQLDSSITAKRNVHIFIFALVSIEGRSFEKRSEQYVFLKNQGFECVEQDPVIKDNLADAVENFKKRIPDNDYPSDGLVLQYDDIAYGESLGITAKFPRNAIAFKWKDEEAVTKLKFIDWSASRTGLINPVAVFEPVELEGTTVSRASVHNVSVLEELKLGIGDEIKVYKANMIIPQISGNLTKSGNLYIPRECPVCSGNTKLNDDDGVKVLFCMNPECPAKRIKSFALFTSRDAFNIEGLNEATLEKLISHHIIAEYSDIFNIRLHREAVLDIKETRVIRNADVLVGFGEKNFNNLCEAVEKSRKITPARFIYSLGIPGVGISTAKLIAKAYGNELKKLLNLNYDELLRIDGVGNVIAGDYVSFFKKFKNVRMINDLLKEVKIEAEQSSTEVQKENTISDKTFVITGDLRQFENRSALKNLIEERGGKVTNTVTSKTDYLISDDFTSGSSKTITAKKLGISIITEEDFLKLAGIYRP